MVFFKKKREALKEEERTIKEVLMEKEEAKKEIQKITRKSQKISEALKRERQYNHYSQRMRILMGSHRKRTI